MQDGFIPLFDKPPRGPNSRPTDLGWHGAFWILVSPITISLLVIAAGLSFPWGYVQRIRVRRSERRFAEGMKSAGRLIPWSEFENSREARQGTVINESLAPKGPCRTWWTADDIPALSPYRCDWSSSDDSSDDQAILFFKWCRDVYTDPSIGKAKLVVVPGDARKDFKRYKLASARSVSTLSWVRGRKQQTA
jgi:hypothetical protein